MTPPDEFVAYALDQHSAFGEVRARPMFGGWGIYHQGVMFALIAYGELYYKVDDTNRADYEAVGSAPFTYEGKGKPVNMSYWHIGEDILESPDALADWARKAFAVAVANKKPKKRGQ